MKKLKLGLSLLVVLVMMLSLSACGGAKEGVLRIGVDDMYPPFEYHDEETNELIGFDVDFANALAEEMGVEIEWIPTAWDGIFNGLEAGQYDVIISCTSITPGRLEVHEMSVPYLANGIVIVSPTGATAATTVEELAGFKVGVQLETTADVAAEKFIADGHDLDLAKFDTIMDGFNALKGGSIDYILVDSSVGGDYVLKDPDTFVVTSDLLSNEPIGVTIAGGNTDLKEEIDEAIAAIQADGTMTDISMKWFAADFATNIDEEIKVIE